MPDFLHGKIYKMWDGVVDYGTEAEMFLPANIVAGASLPAQYVTTIMCVAEVLFFSASIPCVMGTDIDISIKDIIIIWAERVILSLVIAGLVVRFLFPILGVPVV